MKIFLHFPICVSALAALILPTSLTAATILVTGGSDPVISGQQLQTAVNSAQPGDTILVSPNEYRGPITLPNKPNPAGKVITIQSSAAAANLPRPGVRTGPQYSSYLPQITGQNGLDSFHTDPGASYYSLINLEMRPLNSGSLIYQLLTLGSGGPDQSTFAAVPQFLTIDRCYIHGFPNANFKQAIQLNSGNTNIINSYIADFHSSIQDSTGITGFNGPGPYKIVNNYIEAAGENIIFGGVVPALVGNIPSNILIAGNDFAKQLAYKNWDKVDPATYQIISQTDPDRIVFFSGRRITNFVYRTKGAYTPNVKNMIEFKFGQDVNITGNTFTNTYVQADQFGLPIVLTPRTEGGGVPWATVQRINISNNIFRHQGGAIAISDRDPGQTGPATNNITLYNNLFDDLRSDYAFDYERLFNAYGITNLKIDHNTLLSNYEYFHQSGTVPITNFTYTNNIAVYGQGFSSDCGYNSSAYACSTSGFTLTNNVFLGGNPGAFPGAGQSLYFPGDVNSVGFVNAANLGADYHNYALASSSPFKGKGTRRTDIGFMPALYDYARALGF